MPCFHPIKAYRSKELTVNGKRKLVFTKKDSTGDVQEIPCGQCIGCRLDRSLDWAVRISNEASMHENNCFITLTYAPEFLPSNGTLVLEHFQKFLKRLRKKYGKVRFFHCGEYGESFSRPHYHACLLGFDFPDKRFLRTSQRGDHVFSSQSLDTLWGYGRTEIGSVTFESAAYVARYITKKVTGKLADDHYSRIDPYTGEIFKLKPEYTTMSRNPGIGNLWLRQFHRDVFRHDRLVTRKGAKISPPRYYSNLYEIIDPSHHKTIINNRLSKQFDSFSNGKLAKLRLDTTSERLKVREKVQEATLSTFLNRNLEG